MTDKKRVDFSEPFSNRRREAFARARARGATDKAAAQAAGYTPRQGRRLRDDPALAARVAWLRASFAGGGSRDIAAQIEELIALGQKARELPDGRGLAVARACVVDAAKLKQQLPSEPPLSVSAAAAAAAEAADLAEYDRQLSDEEWEQRYGPEPPGGKIVGKPK